MIVRGIAIALCAACIALLAPADDARACGAFFRSSTLTEDRKPSLAYEQTLIVFDREKRREHFIRDVSFRAADERFGFVVPTPSRPSVDKLKQSPFASLRTNFPYSKGIGLGSLGGIGHGARGGAGFGSGVQLIETKQVGSFTAFVLKATDEKALAKWLEEQKLVSSQEADRWLKHYVQMGFYYVAMRYDPPADAKKSKDARVQAETIRISFDTPLPYYPYFEPAPRPGAAHEEPRLLELWLVSTQRHVPLAARRTTSGTLWLRPFAEGERYANASRPNLKTALGSEQLLPAGELVVQRFMDQKRSRQGYGDVLFGLHGQSELDAKLKKQLEPLLPILDPSLLEAAK